MHELSSNSQFVLKLASVQVNHHRFLPNIGTRVLKSVQYDDGNHISKISKLAIFKVRYKGQP